MHGANSKADRLVAGLEAFGGFVLGCGAFLLIIAWRFLLPLACLFAVVYFAVKLASG